MAAPELPNPRQPLKVLETRTHPQPPVNRRREQAPGV